MSKTLNVPYLPGLDLSDFECLEKAMEAGSVKTYISEVNWPSYFPYMPSVSVQIARGESHFVVLYHVRGLDLRATAMEDNEMVCHDSCCEFFVADPHDGTYYNFEMNCIGTIKAAKRRSRQDFELLSAESLQKIVRHSSLGREQINLLGVHSWRVAFCIPFELMGFDCDSIPEMLYANFYKCADKSDHPHFVSWNPVGTENPDFHRPEYFGTLILK